MLFSKRLKSLRDARNLSQKEFAALLEINPVTLSHYENGKREPDLSRLVMLCSKLSVSADYLLGLSDSMSAASTSSIDFSDAFHEFRQRDILSGLTPTNRETALKHIEFLRSQQDENEKNAPCKEA